MVVVDTGLQGIMLIKSTSRVAQRNGSIHQHVARTSSTCKSNSGGVSHPGPALDDTETAATTRGEHKTASARTSEAHDWQRGAPVGEIPSGAAHSHVVCIRVCTIPSWLAHLHGMIGMTAALGKSIRWRGHRLLATVPKKMGERGKGSARAVTCTD